MFLDWLLKTEEDNISYDELKMLAQDRSRWCQVKMETCHMGRILQQHNHNHISKGYNFRVTSHSQVGRGKVLR